MSSVTPFRAQERDGSGATVSDPGGVVRSALRWRLSLGAGRCARSNDPRPPAPGPRWPGQTALRRESVDVAWEQCDLADVVGTDDPRRPSFEADGEPAAG